MPTHDETVRFWRDWGKLTANQQAAFLRAKISAGIAVSPFSSLTPSEGLPGARRCVRDDLYSRREGVVVDADEERVPGEPHIVWLRIGTHDIFREP